MSIKQSICVAKNSQKSETQQGVRYWLLDQRLHNTVQIYDVVTKQYLILPALRIAKNRDMIRAFYPEEACMIGIIAGQACAEPVVSANQPDSLIY